MTSRVPEMLGRGADSDGCDGAPRRDSGGRASAASGRSSASKSPAPTDDNVREILMCNPLSRCACYPRWELHCQAGRVRSGQVVVVLLLGDLAGTAHHVD